MELTKIDDLIAAKGWNKAKLVRVSGVGRDTINGIASGKENYNIETLKKIASALDVKVVIGFEE